MAPPKNKTVKMDLNSFLNDESFQSSWAADDVDVTKINIPIENASANTIPLEELAAANKAAAAGRRRGPGGDAGFGTWTGRSLMDPALSGNAEPRRFREEYPVPDHPPYRAIINNIPWDITPEGVQAWVEDGLNKPGAVEDLELPKSFNDPSRLKGMAFVTFKEREDLVQALTFSGTRLNERTVYVSVAAPRRGGSGGGFGGSDIDWSAARGSNFQASRPPRERRDEPELEWGAARGSNFQASRPPRERREEPELEWGAARGANFQASRPPRERREEPELEWGAARGSNFQASRPPRERREEPELDWDSARGSHFKSSRPPRERKEEQPIDWSSARGSNFHAANSGEDDSNYNNNNNRSGAPRRPRSKEPELDWGSARGARFGKNNNNESATTSSGGFSGRYNRRALQEEKPTEDNQPKVQASSFEVLRTEDDDDDDSEDNSDEEQTAKDQENDGKADGKPESSSNVSQVQQRVADLSIDDGSDWEVVGKK